MNYLVTCVIPTNERPELLARAINSVVNQTYEGIIEILVVDDSLQYNHSVKEMESPKNRPIRYLWKGYPLGAPASRNIGIKNASGEFIAFLDDDDEWLPKKIEKQMELMNSNKACPLVICWSIDERLNRTNKPPHTITHKMIIKSFNLSATSSYLARRYPLEVHKGFDENLPSSQEYDLAIRLSEHHDVLCVQEPLVIQHVSENQISNNWKRKIKGTIGIFKKHHKEYSIKEYIKTVGLITIFALGFVMGRKVYGILTPMKEMYDKS